MTRRVLLVTSIGADRTQLAPLLGDLLFDRDLSLTVEVVESAEAALALAERCTADRVVAVGGDGTAGAVATGLCRRPRDERPEMGLIPMGTANDFAGSAGLNTLPLAEAATLAITGQTHPVDVGRVDEVAFLNMLTVGFPAELSETTPRPLKDAVGGLAYALHGLYNLDQWQCARMAIRAPGRDFEGDAMAVCVCNGRQTGGGNVVAPDALIDDGLFDVVLVPELSPAELIPSAVRARLGERAVPEAVETWQVPWVEIRVDTPIPTTADGEPRERTWMRCEIDPHALDFALPESPEVAI